MKKHTPHNIESMHLQLKKKNTGSALSVSKFGKLIEKSNHTPRKILGGLSPLEYHKRRRLHTPSYERSQAGSCDATRISEERILKNGVFSYGGKLYCMPTGTLTGSNKVVIWIDPGDKLPARIPVDFNGAHIGDALLVPNCATCQLDRLGKKTKHRKAT